jgi:hypothetical protein
MDTSARKRLEERVAQEVETMLTEGDRASLQGLSRGILLEALENELRFLGFYSHDDRETPVAIHEILEKHLDQWCEGYLWQKGNPILHEQ